MWEPPPLMEPWVRRQHSTLLTSTEEESGKAKHLVNDKTGTRKLPISQSFQTDDPTVCFPGGLGQTLLDCPGM